MAPSAFRRLTSSVAVLALSATSALADLSARDVWADWEGYLTATGYTVASRETATSDGLRVDDLVMTMDLPEEGRILITLGTISFVENDDGSVSIDLPSRMPITIDAKGADDEAITTRIDVTQTDIQMLASGTSGELTYDYSASLMKVALVDVVKNGTAMPPESLSFSLNVSDITSTTVMKTGEGFRNYAYDSTANALVYDLRFDEPENPDFVTLSGGVDGISMGGVVNLPEIADPEDVNLMVKSGLSASGEISTIGGRMDLSGQEDGEPIEISTSSESSYFAAAIGAKGFGYDLSQKNIAVNVAGGDIPIPLTTTAAEFSSGVFLPVLASDKEQPYEFSFTLADFTAPDFLWNLFDPGGMLPHDPATVSLDFTGELKVLEDILDPKVAERMENSDETPFELLSMVIEGLEVAAVGALLEGSGELTFDNSDTTTFDGLPRPTGVVDLRVAGVNALLDTLVAMGIVSDDDAMGARMMMSLFGVPGDEPDTITSRIEVTEEGHVLANGQRIQ